MTDQTTQAPDAEKPISVKETAAPIVMSEGTKLILIALFAVAADRFIKSEAVMGVVLSAGGAVATAAWGLWTRLSQWGALKKLAGLVDDSIAFVGKRPKS